MRIFNGTNSLLVLPLNGSQKLEIHPKSVSQEFMGTNEFLSMVITSLSNSEIAIIVSGPYELNVCANIPTAVNYVVQTLDEAIIRFGLKKKEEEPKIVEPETQNTETKHCTCDDCKCDCEMEPQPEQDAVGEPVGVEMVKDDEEKHMEEEPIAEEEPKVEKKKTRKKVQKK